MAVSMKTIVDLNIKNIGEDLQKNLDRHMKLARKHIATLITKTARNEHRYNHRTGELRNATKSRSIKNATSLIVKTYIDEGIAPYGKYIHNGTGTWSADPFINDAIKKNWNRINEIISKHIDEAMAETFK